MAVLTPPLDGRPYVPHLGHSQAAFPSLLFYQGLFASKLGGWNLAALRAPAALWGALCAPAFYLLLRSFAAPRGAFVFTVLLSANSLFLCLSRYYFPGSVLWFGLLGAAGFLWQGLRRGGLWRFAVAGLCAGLCLHGYVAGRVVPALFALWLLSGRLPGRDGPRASWAQLAAFAGAALLAAAPVLLWAFANRAAYLGKPAQLNVGGPWQQLQHGLWVLPRYAGFLYSRPDGVYQGTDGLSMLPLLRAELLLGLLLPAGLLACLFSPRGAWPRLILLGLAVGLLPALLAGDDTHPNSRRSLLCLPWLFAAGAWVWEGLWRQAEPRWRPWLSRAFWAFAGLGLLLSLHQYFSGLMGSPEMRNVYNHSAVLVAQEHAAFAPRSVTASIDLVLPRTHGLVFPADEASPRLSSYPNFIVLDPADGPQPLAVKHAADFFRPQRGAQRFLLAPYLRNAEPLLKALHPHGTARLAGEHFLLFPLERRWDEAEPFVQLLAFELPEGDADLYRGVVDLRLPPYQPGARLDVWEPRFGEAQRGRRLDLGAALFSDGGLLRAQLDWPGWQLWLDGARVAPGAALELAPGAHRLRLRGTVPVDARGGLPLRLSQDGKPLDPAAVISPLDPRFGFAAELAEEGRPPLRRWELLPSHRWRPPEGLGAPLRYAWRGRLRVPLAGLYRFRLLPGFDGRLRAGTRSASPADIDGLGLDLRAGLPVDLAMEGAFKAFEDLHPETALLQVLRPGSPGWESLPFDWALAPAAFTRP